ncbi:MULTISPECIES: TerD family protein [Streptomyces]|uniref:TerD family protein n=1 Tax=Streptomyces TaxID=1883 RepID=UPI00068DBC8E|nr:MULTISPECIES: TerD family protein [Streptomyces]
MTLMIKGANAPLPKGPFHISVARERRPGSPLMSVAAVLLDAAGRARGAADVIRADTPPHASGAVRHLGGAQEGGRLVHRLQVDERAVEPAVQRVLIAVFAPGGTFGAVVEVAGGEGRAVARYEPVDAGGETALVLGELYRRDGAWRFRAVGQGYTAGPAALAADYGVPTGCLPAAPLPGPAMTEVHKEAAPRPGSSPAALAVPAAAAVLTMSKAVPKQAAEAVPAGEASRIGPAAGLYEGHGKQELTVPNPEPGRPAVVEFERLRGPRPHSWLYIWRLDETGTVDQLCVFSSTRDARGRFPVFSEGEPEARLRIEASGDWRLRIRPVDTVDVLGGRAEGRGPFVLRYAGPPALLRAACDGPEDVTGYVHTVQPDGTGHRVGQIGSRIPMTGPLAVGPEGWCHVFVKLDHAAAWKLEVLPVGAARTLDGKLSGHGWEVVAMPASAKVKVRVDRGSESDTIVMATMDAHLRPERQLCGEPGVHPVPAGLVAIRTSEKWSLKVRR